ncbi:MAG TPA: VOC family protein [Gemmatimonadaceae bacterium]
MTAISTTPATSNPAVTANRGRFVWTELMTNDIVRARDFYTKVIGWTTKNWNGANKEYVTWLAGETPIGGLMPLPEDAKAMGTPPSWLAYVEVPDVDATVEQAVKLGAKVLAPKMVIPDVGRLAVLRDPQGAVIAVITSAKVPQPETDPRPLEFSWHELVTTDQVGAIDFYQKLFGWDSKGDFDMEEGKGTYKMFGRDRFTYGGVMTKPSDMPVPSHWLHYISVKDSADAAAERATKAGGKLMLGPMEVPGGDRIAILTDPQGAMFAVHSKPTVK